MKQQNKFIWVDVSKNILHIYDQFFKTYFKVKNNEHDIYEFFSGYNTDYYIIYEPTGSYSMTLEKVLNNLELNHLLVHPNDMYHLINSLGLKNKNDKLDAKQIAKVGQTLFEQFQNLGGKNKFIQPNSNQVNQLHHYMSQIRFLKDQIVRFKQWLETIDNNPYDWEIAKKAYKNFIQQIEDSIEEIKNKAKEIIYQMNMFDSYKNLQTIPGVWESIALEMIVFFLTMRDKWLKKNNNKQVIAYSWLNPIEDQSGSSKNGAYISRQGNPNIRTAIYMTGIQWCKWYTNDKYSNTIIGKFTQRMKDKFASSKNKRWKSVGCAVGKKIIETWRAMFCDWTEYNFS